MSIWFVVFIAVCACVAVPAALLGAKRGIHIGGQKISPVTVMLALVIIVIAWALAAATQFGFIPNHAP